MVDITVDASDELSLCSDLDEVHRNQSQNRDQNDSSGLPQRVHPLYSTILMPKCFSKGLLDRVKRVLSRPQVF